MTVAEAAARLGLDAKTVYRLCQRGALPHHRYGRRVVIEESDLIRFKDAHRVEAPPERPKPLPSPRRAALDGRAVMEEARRRLKTPARARS